VTSSLSDAFPGAHGTGVNGFSWFAAALEIVGALVFGAAGAYAWRQGAAPAGTTTVVRSQLRSG
jgi:hypothetical protein